MSPVAERTPQGATRPASVAALWAGDLTVDHCDDMLVVSLRLVWDGAPPESVPQGGRLRIVVSDLDRLGGDRRHLLAAHTPPNATALVPLVAVIAAASGADLTIDAPVCPVAVAGARRGVAAGQLAHGWTGVTLGATAGATSPRRREGTGLVFSLGLEPLAHLVALRQQGTPPTHLITLDDRTTTTAEWSAAPRRGASADTTGDDCRRWRAEAMAANAARLPLVRVATNAHQFLPHHRVDAIARHAVVSSCGLALAGVVGAIVVPAGPALSEIGLGDTIGLWSSGSVEITRPDNETTLMEAASLVATDRWARGSLQVCSSHSSSGNCGACHPCQLVLTHLWLAGASEGIRASFGHDANPAIVRALDPTPVLDRGDHLAMIDALSRVADGSDRARSPASPDDRLLAAALADAWTTHLERCSTSRAASALSA